MAIEPLTIEVESESELARVIKQADTRPLVLEHDGVRYRVVREPAVMRSGHDPQRLREALRKSAGALAGVDVDKLLRDLREQRGQDSHGRPA